MTTTRNRFLIVCRKPPFGTSYAREALDVALAGAAFDQEISLLFLDDGVFQLRSGQGGDPILLKGAHNALPALAMYDIKQVFVDEDSMRTRSLLSTDLCIAVESINDNQVKSLFQQHDILLNF